MTNLHCCEIYVELIIFFLSFFLFQITHTRAGTGKSTLIKEIVLKTCSGRKKKTGYNLYLINVDGKDSASFKKNFPKVKNISFEELPSVANKSCIVVEDIINISKKDEQLLRTAINYQAHHKTQKILCASHAIYKTQVYSLLGFFNYIIFTSSVANVPTIRNVLNYFKIEKSQINDWLNLYKEFGNGKHGIYFYFDCEKMTFGYSKKTLFKHKKILGIVGSNSTTNENETSLTKQNERAKKLQEIFNKFVENLPQKNEAISVFSIIANCVDSHYIRSQDLTITFMTKKGEKKPISLVDYVISILSPEIIVKPPMIAIHRFIEKFCKIPILFVRNPSFSL